MTIMRLGPVEFDLAVNPQDMKRNTQTPYAVHQVVGARPIREFTGEGDGRFTITGVVFPHHFGGGRLGLAAIEIARQAHTPVPFIRGNLVPLGWVLIEELEVSDTEIGEFGIGNEINFSATLVLTDRPGASMAPAILSLFS